MKLIAARKYSFLDAQTLSERQARDTLFRYGENSFLLHMTSGEEEDDQIMWLDSRAALLWINQSVEEYGSI
ncbi:hypothetical protein CWO91_13975 [Bradyrhizobium genosp. SA-3]|uniref:hypothetical protein n=1 Tax=Bradyrhizobium genosp. SA-3 TaxID=508868 RepID=UPI0010291C67|nr:hypothetical protein [Bradyrhizobium genosp. SA-3]RZN10296.1 hypothetical protein CWO91_13975 [Bradyrhizobium genosp. SA-3]